MKKINIYLFFFCEYVFFFLYMYSYCVSWMMTDLHSVKWCNSAIGQASRITLSAHVDAQLYICVILTVERGESSLYECNGLRSSPRTSLKILALSRSHHVTLSLWLYIRCQPISSSFLSLFVSIVSINHHIYFFTSICTQIYHCIFVSMSERNEGDCKYIFYDVSYYN